MIRPARFRRHHNGVTMHRIVPTIRSVLSCTAAAVLFVATTYGQSILGPANEANHFIATPQGWAHPKTAWGEPDITATLNMMQAAGVPLERCANAIGGRGGACDMNKAWRTEEEYKQALEIAAGRIDPSKALIEKGEFGRALLS